MMDLEVVSVDIVADLEDIVVVLVDMAVVLVDLVIMDKISMIFGLYVINLCIMYITKINVYFVINIFKNYY